MGTQIFAAVTAPYFSAEQILNARNVFAVPVGVEFCFYGLVKIDGNNLRIGFRKDFITEAVNARVLFIVQQKVDTVHKERFAAVGDAAGVKVVCNVGQAFAVRVL